jgi:hypothetical protein
VEDWDCLLDPSDGGAFVAVTGLDLSNATSGETTLYAPGMAVLDEKIVFSDASQAVFGTTATQSDRRLAATGVREVVVVRITCGANVVSKSLETIKSDVFSDAASLKSQMEACSNNALTINPGPAGGAMEVSISNCAGNYAAVNSATIAVTNALGRSPASFANTHFMFCLPPGIGWNGVAYAYANHWLSVYNDAWCTYVSAQVHEVGHNLNLNHAGEGSEEYGDQTGFMGYSWSLDDEKMCYNAANMYQLGWLKYVQEFSSRPSGAYNLVGHTNFGGGLQAIRLQGTPALRDTYIWFNNAVGINADSREARDQVIVTTHDKGVALGKTLMVARLGVGGIYSPSDAYYSVQVTSIANGQATISFDVVPPTLAPAPLPTLPPVPLPTLAPAPLPTLLPVPITTLAPVATSPPLSPPLTVAPLVVVPTSPPVSPPTTAPVPVPTNPPVSPNQVVRASLPTPITCPNVRKANKCPKGCVFNSSTRTCRAPRTA